MLSRQPILDPRRRWRQRWRTLHLWLGLGVGVWFMLLGLTGSALVFYREIDGWLNPAVVVAPRPQPERNLGEIFARVQSAHPDRTRGWRLEIPAGDNRAYTARYYFSEEKAHKHFAPLLVTIDPYTLQLRASRFWGEFAMTFIYDLHYLLLLDDWGSTLVAVLGMLMLVSLGSGLWLWWPRGEWRPAAFTLRRRASTARRVYDLHKLGGVYGVLLLALLAGTGTLLARPDWFEPALDRISPVHAMPTWRVQSPAGATRIGPDEAAEIALRALPGARLRWLETPDGPQGAYRLRLQQPGEPSARFPHSYVWVDPYAGTALGTRRAEDRSASDSLLAWLHPLHNGEAFGLAGRWIVFLTGLLPLLLGVTGWMRWRQKVAARPRH